MFKRFLSALAGQKGKPPAASSPGQNDSQEPPAGQEEMIVAYDAYGREMRIARSDWREKVFLPSLEEKWDKPDDLYDAILTGLRDGFAADLNAASARLVEIDADAERGHVMHGIVLLQTGQLDAAEKTLRSGIEKVGETGTLLTNLAKVFAERGDQVEAETILWRGIELDPNQDNGMLWWVSLQQEKWGEAGYLDALNAVAALPGSWRAQLWLARHHLEHGNVEAARALYQQVLASGSFDSRALMMISGDLGNHGQIALIADLVAPVYDEHRHDPMAGLNLLRAYQELGRVVEGEALLARLYALGFAPLRQHLDGFAQAFLRLGQQAAKATPMAPEEVQFSTLALTQPIWQYSLCKADWLFAQKPEAAPQVGFVAWSKTEEGAERSEVQREDDGGRLTRAIPLYLAEAVHYWSDYAGHCFISLVEGGGPVVSTREITGEDLFDGLPSAMTHVVTGMLGSSGEGKARRWHLALTLWDCTTRTAQATERGEADDGALGALVLKLEQAVLSRIGRGRDVPLDLFYHRPSAEAMAVYLAELGQSLTLTFAANERVPRSALWGERTMLDWPLNMALHWPSVATPKLMYLSSLAKAYDYRSDVLMEYRERTLQLLRDAEGPDSPERQLQPLVWKIFGMQEEFEAHRFSLPADASPAYRAWLERVAAK